MHVYKTDTVFCFTGLIRMNWEAINVVIIEMPLG